MIPDSLVDHAYSVMCEELNHWQIVGPLEQRRANLPPRTFWNAVRTEETAAIDARPDPIIFHMDSKANAIACVQWHGLKAVITALKGELGLIPSNDDSTSNG